MQTTFPKISMEMSLPKVDIDIDKAQISIQHRPVKVKVDAGDAYSEIGLKSSRSLAKQKVLENKSHAQRIIKDIANMGDMLTKIEEEIDMISVTKEQSAPKKKDVNVDVIPKSPLDLEFSGGLELAYQPARIKHTLLQGKLVIRSSPGKVHVSAGLNHEHALPNVYA